MKGSSISDGLVSRVQQKWSNLHAKDNLSENFYISATHPSHSLHTALTFSVCFTAADHHLRNKKLTKLLSLSWLLSACAHPSLPVAGDLRASHLDLKLSIMLSHPSLGRMDFSCASKIIKIGS